jgi:hypothetical protein
MDEEVIWIPCVQLCQHILTKEFKLIEFGMKEGGGASYMVGPIRAFSEMQFAKEGLALVKRALEAYRTWPADTKFTSEFGAMRGRQLHAFIRQHLFVEVLQREKGTLSLCPQHRTGDTWREIASGYQDENALVLPITQQTFYAVLLKCFSLAS